MSQDLIETIEGGVATLTMNRPEARNALTRDMMAGLLNALTSYATNPNVRAIVITGTGKAFCSGGDVKNFAKAASGEANNMGTPSMSFDQKVNDLRQRVEVARLIHEIPKPTLAVVPGPAAGAGLSIALACDLRIAADDAKFTTAFAKIGLSGDFGGSYFLSHLVGPGLARELYFTGRVVDAAEALRIGMINQVVPADQLAAAAKKMALELANLPTVALGYMKRNLNLAMRGSLNDLLDVETTHMIRTFETEDHKGAAVAFVEKRAPTFKGC